MSGQLGVLTLAQLVVERPARLKVLQKHKLDFCCGGRRPLSVACAERKLDLASVEEALAAVGDGDARQARLARGAALRIVVEHITKVHHAPSVRTMSSLEYFLNKMAQHHGGDEPHLPALRDAFVKLKRALAVHYEKEQQGVFRYCRSLTTRRPRRAPAGLDTAITELFTEHAEAGRDLEKMRTLAKDWMVPPGRCDIYARVMDNLRKLEQDLHRHIFEENNLLFPLTLLAAMDRGK